MLREAERGREEGGGRGSQREQGRDLREKKVVKKLARKKFDLGHKYRITLKKVPLFHKRFHS